MDVVNTTVTKLRKRNQQNKLVIENKELKAWIREIEIRNDNLERENTVLRNALKEIL